MMRERMITVCHEPLHKFRAVVFAKTAIPIKGSAGIGLDGFKMLYDACACRLFGDQAPAWIDPSCRSPSQPIYLPAAPPDSIHESQVIAIDGDLLAWEPLWKEVSEKVEQRRLALAEKRNRRLELGDDETLESLQACLEQIPPDDYRTWITAMFAVFNVTDGSEGGLALFHNWSSASEKYDEGVINSKWNGLASPDTSESVGIGTLIYLAREFNPNFQPRRPAFNLSLLGFQAEGE